MPDGVSDSCVYEVRVFPRDSEYDPRRTAIAAQAGQMLGEQVLVDTAAVYQLELPATSEGATDAQTLATELLTNPVTQYVEVGTRTDYDDANRLEVGYRPGVQDPQAAEIKNAAQQLGVNLIAAATATQYRFAPDTPAKLRKQVVSGLLVNTTVQEQHRAPRNTLLVSGEAAPVCTLPMDRMSLAEMRELSQERSWHMLDSDLLTVQRYAIERGRGLTDVEAEFMAGRRSDHCAHLTFGAEVKDGETGQTRPSLFSRIKATARDIIIQTDNVLSAFDDNAGVLRFYEGQAVNIKKESHNSPSAVEPRGGAATGTGGVIRDILGTGQGFKPILLDAMFGLAPLNLHASLLPEGCLPPAYLTEGVIAGTSSYGNQMGIPTGDVTTMRDVDFRAKPTVLAGAYGIAPERYAYQGTPQVGDLVITIGGRTGRDGLHGATFASGNMTAETSTKNASSVQIGDPIQERNLQEALLEARDAGLIRALTDCGAAGYGSAVGELGEHTGVTIDLDKIPTKYAGLTAWELLMSESQERMVLAVADDPEAMAHLARIMAKHDVEWANIGVFDGSDHFTATFKGEQVAHISYEFLQSGFNRGVKASDWHQPKYAERLPVITDWTSALKTVLASDNVRSSEAVMRRYDHGVQASMILPPYGGKYGDMPHDAVAVMPLKSEFPGKFYGMIRSHAVNPAIMRIDPKAGAITTTAEALARYVAVGGCPVNDADHSVAMMNNYVWPTPEDPQTFGSLEQAVDGVNESQKASGVPVISGKDSVSSRYKGNEVIDIPPVLDMTVVGGIPDARKTISGDIKRAGSTLVLVGAPDYEGMAGSVLYDTADGESARVAKVDLEQLPKTLYGMYKAIQTGKVLSTSAISRGGLIASVAKMNFGGDTGAVLDLDGDVPLDRLLYNETGGCMVVEVDSAETAATLFGDMPYTVIGQTTTEKDLIVRHGDHTAFTASTDELKAAWKHETKETRA
jgi:phosphoribosylformylglycinamidine synthase II